MSIGGTLCQLQKRLWRQQSLCPTQEVWGNCVVCCRANVFRSELPFVKTEGSSVWSGLGGVVQSTAFEDRLYEEIIIFGPSPCEVNVFVKVAAAPG